MVDQIAPIPIEVIYADDQRTKQILREVGEVYPFKEEVAKIVNYSN